MLALGVLLRCLSRPVTLVALGSTLGGLVDLRLIGTGISETSGLAGHIAGWAFLNTDEFRPEGDGRSRSLSNGA